MRNRTKNVVRNVMSSPLALSMALILVALFAISGATPEKPANQKNSTSFENQRLQELEAELRQLIDALPDEYAGIGDENSWESSVSDGACCVNPGDVDGSGNLNIADFTFLLAHFFGGGAAPACFEEADVNHDCELWIGDAAFIISFIFLGGPAPICDVCVPDSPIPNPADSLILLAGGSTSCNNSNPIYVTAYTSSQVNAVSIALEFFHNSGGMVIDSVTLGPSNPAVVGNIRQDIILQDGTSPDTVLLGAWSLQTPAPQMAGDTIYTIWANFGTAGTLQILPIDTTRMKNRYSDPATSGQHAMNFRSDLIVIDTCAPAPPCEFIAEGDDITSSLGLFRVLVHPDFQARMLDYPGYDNATGKLTSPVLSDRNTIIGRSATHQHGDATDIGGTPVGTAGTMISDADLIAPPVGFQGPDGTSEIHTEVRSLNMIPVGAVGAAVRAGVAAPLQPPSAGEIEALANFSCFPAQSFFNVYVEVDLAAGGNGGFAGATLYNMDPLIVDHGLITKFPPKVVYIHDNPEAVKVYDRATDSLFGWLILAGHGVDFDANNVPTSGSGRLVGDLELFESIMAEVEDLCCLTAGDANSDSKVNISDVTFLIARIFAGGDAPSCQDQADSDGNNKLNIADVTYLIARIFAGGSAPVCGTTKT